MATAPARTVSWFKRVTLMWSANLIVTFLIPLVFAASFYGIAKLLNFTQSVVYIIAVIAGIAAALEGGCYFLRRIQPQFFDANRIVAWSTLRRPILIYIALLSCVPIAALIACPLHNYFDPMLKFDSGSWPSELVVAAVAVIVFALVLAFLHEMTEEFVWKYQRGQIICTAGEIDEKLKAMLKQKKGLDS